MFGVSPYTIAKYRVLGVLPPPTPARGRYAAYGAEHVKRMQAIWGRNGTKDAVVTITDLAERWNPRPEDAR